MTIEKVKELLAEHLDMNADELTAETEFSDLGIDSLDIAEIMMEAEDEFGVEIKFEEVGKTIGSLADYIDSKKA